MNQQQATGAFAVSPSFPERDRKWKWNPSKYIPPPPLSIAFKTSSNSCQCWAGFKVEKGRNAHYPGTTKTHRLFGVHWELLRGGGVLVRNRFFFALSVTNNATCLVSHVTIANRVRCKTYLSPRTTGKKKTTSTVPFQLQKQNLPNRGWKQNLDVQMKWSVKLTPHGVWKQGLELCRLW